MTAFEQMPYPAYIESLATVIIGLLIPLFAVLSFAFVIPPILKRWVIEIDEQMGRAVDRLIYEEISLFISTFPIIYTSHIILIGTRGFEVNQPNWTLNSWVLLL